LEAVVVEILKSREGEERSLTEML